MTGLCAVALKRLEERQQACQAWLRRTPEEVSYPEMQEFRLLRPHPGIYRMWHQAILLEGAGLGEVLARLLALQRVYGWPIGQVRAAQPEAAPLVDFLSPHLCEGPLTLWVALEGRFLTHLQEPMTFALCDEPEACFRGRRVPDLTGYLGQPPTTLEFECRRDPDLGSFCPNQLRPALQPTPGWEERARLCHQERAGRILSQLLQQTHLLLSLLEAAQQILAQDVSPAWPFPQLWDRFPELRPCLLQCDDIQPQQLGQRVEAVLQDPDSDPSWRENCITWIEDKRWHLSDPTLQALQSQNEEEFSHWLSRQTPQQLPELLVLRPAPPPAAVSVPITPGSNRAASPASAQRRPPHLPGGLAPPLPLG